MNFCNYYTDSWFEDELKNYVQMPCSVAVKTEILTEDFLGLKSSIMVNGREVCKPKKKRLQIWVSQISMLALKCYFVNGCRVYPQTITRFGIGL